MFAITIPETRIVFIQSHHSRELLKAPEYGTVSTTRTKWKCARVTRVNKSVIYAYIQTILSLMLYTLFVTILLKPCNFIIKKWFYYILIKLVLTGAFFFILSLKPVELCTNCINDGGFYIIKTSLTMYNETGLTLYYVPMNWILMQENIKKIPTAIYI